MPPKRKGAHIYKRPGRHGWYAYVDRDNRDISLETEDEQEAQAKLLDLLDRRGLRPLAEGDRPIAEAFAEHLRRSKTNHTKKTTYEHGLNGSRVLKWLAARGIHSARAITREIVEDYKTARRFDKVSAARINREIDTWKAAMRVAVELGHAHRSVLESFAKLREPRPQPHQVGLSNRQINAFLAKVDDDRYRALFATVAGSGIRDDEARHLEAGDIQGRQLVVTPKPGWTTKGYRHRSIPISPATAKAAKAYVAAKSTMSLDPKGIWKRIQAARKAAALPHFSMHDLRRSWASLMLATGHRLEDISRWLGHADIMTTMRYLRVVAAPATKRLPR